MQENTLALGWQEHATNRPSAGRAPAANLQRKIAPPSLRAALSKASKGAPAWRDACDEEYEGLEARDTMARIGEKEYQRLLDIHGGNAQAIPSMSLLTAKYGREGKPARAKSRIVVLGRRYV